VNIDKMKIQHAEIIHKISRLRELSREGVTAHAQEIAQTVISMSSVIKVHLFCRRSVFISLSGKGERSKAKTMSVNFQRDG
jgi:hypothetical protein